MLFAKHGGYAEIKRTVKADGIDAVYINIRYVSPRGKGRLDSRIRAFYGDIAAQFERFAETELAAHARKHIRDVGFSPAAAVMKQEVRLDGKKYLSVFAEVSVFDGLSGARRRFDAHIWDKKHSCIIPRRALLSDKADEILAERFSVDRRIVSSSALCFTDKGIELTFSQDNEKRVLALPFEAAVCEGILGERDDFLP